MYIAYPYGTFKTYKRNKFMKKTRDVYVVL